jgi:hypothetical protein
VLFAIELVSELTVDVGMGNNSDEETDEEGGGTGKRPLVDVADDSSVEGETEEDAGS